MKYLVPCLLGCSILQGQVAIAKDQPVPVTIIELLASPGRFDGDLISVDGFLVMTARGSLLYLHREDAEHVLRNAVKVVASEEMARRREEFNGMYVKIVGAFHVVPGVRGQPIREITEVKSCAVWSNPMRPRGAEWDERDRMPPRQEQER